MIIPIELQTTLFIFFNKSDVRRISKEKFHSKTDLCRILFFDKDDNKTFEMIDTKGYYKVLSKVFKLYKKRHLTPSIIEVDEF